MALTEGGEKKAERQCCCQGLGIFFPEAVFWLDRIKDTKQCASLLSGDRGCSSGETIHMSLQHPACSLRRKKIPSKSLKRNFIMWSRPRVGFWGEICMIVLKENFLHSAFLIKWVFKTCQNPTAPALKPLFVLSSGGFSADGKFLSWLPFSPHQSWCFMG